MWPWGLAELLLDYGLVMVINQKFFVSGFKGLIHRAPNMDTLVALGSHGLIMVTVFMRLFAMTDASDAHGDGSAVM